MFINIYVRTYLRTWHHHDPLTSVPTPRPRFSRPLLCLSCYLSKDPGTSPRTWHDFDFFNRSHSVRSLLLLPSLSVYLFSWHSLNNTTTTQTRSERSKPTPLYVFPLGRLYDSFLFPLIFVSSLCCYCLEFSSRPLSSIKGSIRKTWTETFGTSSVTIQNSCLYSTSENQLTF